MIKSKIKQWLCVLSIIMGIVFFQGCDVFDPYYSDNMPKFGFIESEQVVEVDVDTESFRILGKWTEGTTSWFHNPRFPRVYLDTLNTTARHNQHFISHIDPEYGSIGYFTSIDSDKTYREREVKLLPENITSELIIYYDIPLYLDSLNSHNLINRHKVILRPKANEK